MTIIQSLVEVYCGLHDDYIQLATLSPKHKA